MKASEHSTAGFDLELLGASHKTLPLKIREHLNVSSDELPTVLAKLVEPGGEGLVLSGISFLLGSILGSLRQGGGEVQESLGVGVKTLIMPLTAKLFVGLMMMGLMIEMVQFGFYLFVATLDGAPPKGRRALRPTSPGLGHCARLVWA